MRVIEWIWQGVQGVMGLVVLGYVYIRYRGIRCERYRSAWVFRYRSGGGLVWGVSFGPIILVSEAHSMTAVRHEYGHSIQSRILGPVYLVVVGIPSIVMNVLTRVGIMDSERYYERWPESWADRLGGVRRGR